MPFVAREVVEAKRWVDDEKSKTLYSDISLCFGSRYSITLTSEISQYWKFAREETIVVLRIGEPLNI